MAVAAAEQTTYIQPLEQAEFLQPALVSVVPEMAQDEFIRHKAARFIGAVAVNSWEDTRIEPEYAATVRPLESLYEAIQAAAKGDEEAYKMVETNVATDVIERTMKAGHITKVDLMVDEAGRLQQHGQSLNSVQANSLRYAANSWQMRERTEAETRNAFRIEQYYKQGTLEGYSFVVFSRAADNMSTAEMDETGFFTETMSCAIQVTSAEDDRLVTETAFVAGVKQQGETRHDEQTVIDVTQEFGIDMTRKNAAEIIDTPLLVHNSLIPNGATDFVALWDKHTGNTFFGQAKPVQDYANYKQTCVEREQRFAPKVETIISQLLAEAPLINTPLEATQRLHKISEEQMIEQAVGDDDIDPRVFGSTSAQHIERARQAYELDRPEELLQHIQAAKTYAESSSCAGGGPSSKNASAESSQSTSDNCEFVSKECPKCHTKNVKTTVTKTRISGSCGCSSSR